MKNTITKIYTLCLTMLLSGFFVYGQTETTVKSKEHYIIHQNGSKIDVEKLTSYLNTGFFNLDEFRFYDKRRIIEFEGTTATIELYSAKELFEIYGKHVAESTIMPGTTFKEITFAIYPETKGIKPQLK
jgi:hypothetical protein